MINYANKNISVIFFKYGLVKISTLESDFLCTLDNFYNCVITNGAEGLFVVEDIKHKIQFNFRFIELLSRVENCSLDFKTFFISEWLSVYTTYTHTIGYYFSTHYYEPLLEFIEELWQSNTEFDIMDLKNIEDVYDYFL